MNYLNKNKPILKTKDTTNNINDHDLVSINKKKINLITSQPIQKKYTDNFITSKKNVSKKNLSKKNKQKRFTEPIYNDNIDFPQGNKYKCIGPCFPANMLYYHPLTLQAIKSKNNSCPIELQKIGDKIKIKDKCTLNEKYNYNNYDMFADVIQVATSDNNFLEQIYNIKNIYDVELFLENNMKQLPNLSQIRIINSIYKVYRDNDSFPSNNFVSLVKSLIKKNHDIKIKSKKILSKIMENKYSNKWNNIINGIIE